MVINGYLLMTINCFDFIWLSRKTNEDRKSTIGPGDEKYLCHIANNTEIQFHKNRNFFLIFYYFNVYFHLDLDTLNNQLLHNV